MSSDNGIYILQTPKGDGFEYRVTHLQAVENVYWHVCPEHYPDLCFGNEEGDNRPRCDVCTFGECDHSECHIVNAREMWDVHEVFTDRTKALEEADRQAQGCDILEYGISFIKIPEEF